MAKLRNREIKRLWSSGKTMTEIAEEFGISKQRVHQIIYNVSDNWNGNPLREVKKAILKRDNYQCLRCNDKTKSHLTINHIIPRIIGGTDEPKNLETLCYKCNRLVFAELVRKALKLYFANIKPDYRKSIIIKPKKK